MKRSFASIALLAFAATAVFAGPVEDREALMKERGATMGALAKFAKGETTYDAAAVLEQLNKLDANGKKMDIDVLWAASETGNTAGSPSSAPKIWEDMAGFKAEEAKFETAVAAAVAAAPADAAALGPLLGPIGASCGACHEAYRAR